MDRVTAEVFDRATGLSFDGKLGAAACAEEWRYMVGLGVLRRRPTITANEWSATYDAATPQEAFETQCGEGCILTSRDVPLMHPPPTHRSRGAPT